MQELKVQLRNCYGIKKLDTEFDYSARNVYVIYAPNGSMKTSFAKTFDDFSKGVESRDLMFSARESVREIKDENDAELDKDTVFVIESSNEQFKSDKISTLLVNKDLKDEYDEIYSNIDERKSTLLKELRPASKINNIGKIEEEISEAFTHEKDKIFESLSRIESEITNDNQPELGGILYAEVFNSRVIAFLSIQDNNKKILDYIKKYNELIEASTYFRKGIFNHNNADAIAKSLTDNGFFKANHSVLLNSADGDKKITTNEELKQVIEQEKQIILNNPELLKAFNEIDNKLKANAEMRHFRDYLLVNLDLLPHLGNLPSLRQNLWIAYLKNQKELYTELLKEYRSGEKRINEIIQQSRAEETRWRQVVDIFNERFFVPFKVEVINQDDVILRRDVPTIGFRFYDKADEVKVGEADLLRVLSSGEKRALYILNILFEIEARKDNKQESLFIFDDIADSFDYKNKYAIIEYLKEIAKEDYFYQIILTHNFDFFRTIQSRFHDRDMCNMVIKTDDDIKLVAAGYFKPFTYFVNNLHTNPDILIASIPFVRNIVEYTRKPEHEYYDKLTSLLHLKEESTKITVKDLEDIYRVVLCDPTLELSDKDKIVIDLIFERADNLEKETIEQGINLENKIVLSIAIRLKTEEYLKNEINDPERVNAIEGNQTTALYDIYKEKHAAGNGHLKLIEQVNLMTPENIHFNSFMYEPIIDMADLHLKRLYTNIKAVLTADNHKVVPNGAT